MLIVYRDSAQLVHDRLTNGQNDDRTDKPKVWFRLLYNSFINFGSPSAIHSSSYIPLVTPSHINHE